MLLLVIVMWVMKFLSRESKIDKINILRGKNKLTRDEFNSEDALSNPVYKQNEKMLKKLGHWA